MEIAREHEFQIWLALAMCLEGAALAAMAQPEDGLETINRGIDLYQDMKTPPVFWPLLLHMRADVSARAGRPEEGVAMLDEALEILGKGSVFVLASELCRLRGTLTLSVSPNDTAAAESWFRQALEIAGERKATMLELRAAIELRRLWQEQGKPEEGRQLLSGIYGKLSEGFETPDVEEAKALIASAT